MKKGTANFNYSIGLTEEAHPLVKLTQKEGVEPAIKVIKDGETILDVELKRDYQENETVSLVIEDRLDNIDRSHQFQDWLKTLSIAEVKRFTQSRSRFIEIPHPTEEDKTIAIQQKGGWHIIRIEARRAPDGSVRSLKCFFYCASHEEAGDYSWMNTPPPKNTMFARVILDPGFRDSGPGVCVTVESVCPACESPITDSFRRWLSAFAPRPANLAILMRGCERFTIPDPHIPNQEIEALVADPARS